MNLAYIGTLAIKHHEDERIAWTAGLSSEIVRQKCQDMVSYMLGDNPISKSYVIGYDKFGTKSQVTAPHHKNSACDRWDTACDWSYWNGLQDSEPQKHTLYGALIGGTEDDDSFIDSRKRFYYNEVSTDYNAGFQATVAALKELNTMQF